MKLRFYSTEAFTLTEVIVGMVVVTIIGFATWMAVNVLSPSSQATQYRIKAEHLITLSEEELHQYAQNQSNFINNLDNCNFEQPDNNCGFADVSAQFPDNTTPFYTRTLNYINADSTAALKKFVIHVTWQELGKLQFRDSVILLAKPSDPLPGNIYGLVTDRTTAAILNGVQIVANNTPASYTAVSTQATFIGPDGNPANYSFQQPPDTGYFILTGGNWQLTATDPGNSTSAGYVDTPPSFPGPIAINGAPVRADFQMTPQLKPATISGKLINAAGNALSFNGNSTIQLYEGGNSPSNVSSSFDGSNFNFNVSFTNSNQQCFTLFTKYAYRSNLDGPFNCNGYSYQADGWSSAQADINNNVVNCGAPWQGDSSSDNICVTPGQALTKNITLAQVPTATVTVNVVDQNNNPLPASGSDPVWIIVYWHDGTIYQYWTPYYTPGPYTISAPAEQDLFPDGDDAEILAQWGVPVLQCCNQNGTVNRQSQTQPVGPLPPDQVTTLTINTITTSQQCGNADGQVNDAKANTALSGATVTLAGLNQSTVSGDYTFECSQTPPFQVPSGQPYIQASASGYYTFQSWGNNYYVATGPVNIQPNQLNNLGPISLWPMGFGTITGTVEELDQGTMVAMGNVPVVLTLGGGAFTSTAISKSDGTFEFDNVPETWPPSSNPLLNQAVLNYTLSVAATGSYAAYSSPHSFTLTAQGTDSETIILVPTQGV